MKHYMNKLVSLSLGVFTVMAVTAQTDNVAINPTAAPPDATAILDVNSDAATDPKGFLAPRMTRAQRLAIAAPPNALTVYQTNTFGGDEKGFWVYRGTQWERLAPGGAAWELSGTAGTIATTNYIGTTDNQPVVLRSNNVIRGTIGTGGELALRPNITNSGEKLQIDGAIKLSGTSATNDAGVIAWNAGIARHVGNVDGTPTGWKKLENPYDEIFNAAYTQTGAVTCGAGSSDIGPNLITTSTNSVTPFLAGTQRSRAQYLFRRNELDLGIAQLTDPTATSGLCPNEPINSIAVNITGWAGGAGNFISLLRVTIKHTSFNAMGNSFDDVIDPAAQCACWAPSGCQAGAPNNWPLPATTGWQTFNFTNPFIWNGTDNIIIDICYTRSTGAGAAIVTATNNLPFNATLHKWGAASSGSCGAPKAVVCGAPVVTSPAFPISGCGMIAASCGSANAVNTRPVFRFNGTVASAPPATVGSGDYVQYSGGISVEETPGWSNVTIPLPRFEGPGTVKAENGVYSGTTQLNDHVFDLYFDGRVASDEVDAFGNRRHLDVDEMVNYVEYNRHLPTMKGRKDWHRQGGFALDDLTNQIWMTAETQALYLVELNDQVDVLEMLATERALSNEEFDRLVIGIQGMKDITDGKKEQLIQLCKERVSPSTQK